MNENLDYQSKSITLEKSISSLGSSSLFSDLHTGEEDVKKKLEWYFKTPYRKYKERGTKPFKLLIQIVKIIMVTVQATLFAMDEFSIVSFEDDNLKTFRNLFIPDYNNDGVRSLYTKDSVYQHMFYTWKEYYSFEDTVIGSYHAIREDDGSIQPIQFCKTWHAKVKNIVIDYYSDGIPSNEDRVPSNEDCVPSDDEGNKGESIHHCCDLKSPSKPINETTLEEFVATNNLPARIGWILSMQMTFSFLTNNSIYHQRNSPDCYTFDTKLNFDNGDLDGIMTVSLTTKINFYACREAAVSGSVHIMEGQTTGQTAFGLVVIGICILSICLCVRSFRMHYSTYKDAQRFFSEYRHEKLTFSDKIVFVSFWYVLIVLADLFAVFGCILKITIDLLEYPELYAMCSICFGLAVLFSWIGILCYLGFLKDYNILLLTLKVAFPYILRFITCVLFIYVGFLLCGWIVLGPYHEKFATITLASENLFSLLNGDDMFRTYMLVHERTDNAMIIYFSKVYLYVFISLFMFVVLSLFIGIVEDTFEEISEKGCAPKTRVELFMEGNEYVGDDVAGDGDGDDK